MTIINVTTNSNMREARAEPLMFPTIAIAEKIHAQARLQLRWNWQMNCWQVWNYLSNPYKDWKWFSITNEQARSYAAHRVPVVIEETIS